MNVAVVGIISLVVLSGCQSRIESLSGNWRIDDPDNWIDIKIDDKEETMIIVSTIGIENPKRSTLIAKIVKVGNAFVMLDENKKYIDKLYGSKMEKFKLGTKSFIDQTELEDDKLS